MNVRWEYVKPEELEIEKGPGLTQERARREKLVRIRWDPATVRERNYLERATAYRVYRRFGDMGLNDRPCFPVVTVNASTFEFIVDLDLMQVNDISWFTNTNRFAVSALGELSIECELVQAAQVEPEKK